jgi:predicted RNA methylase
MPSKPSAARGPLSDREGAARVRAIVQALGDVLAPERLDGTSVLDLGAGSGEIAVELALRGAHVTAVDGRAANGASIAALAGRHGVRVDVQTADVRRIDWESVGLHDVVVASGLLYHLELADALALAGAIRACCRRLLVLDTEVAWGPVEHRTLAGRRYSGLTFVEHHPRATAGQREASRLASLDNPTSFWLTRDSVHALLRDAGFSSSLELGAPGQPRRAQRATIIALAGARVDAPRIDESAPLGDGRPTEREAGRVATLRLWAARLRRSLTASGRAPRAG